MQITPHYVGAWLRIVHFLTKISYRYSIKLSAFDRSIHFQSNTGSIIYLIILGQ